MVRSVESAFLDEIMEEHRIRKVRIRSSIYHVSLFNGLIIFIWLRFLFSDLLKIGFQKLYKNKKFIKPTSPGTSDLTLSFPNSVARLEAAFTVEIKRAVRSHQVSERPISLLAVKTF